MSDQSFSTAYYLATVWLSTPDHEFGTVSWDSTRQVIRIPACGPDDYQARIRHLWPGKVVTFGPIGLSRIQE